MIIQKYLDLTPVNEDVGIEIEVESNNQLPSGESVGGWRVEGDGSLRGISAEYITPPIRIDEVDTYLSNLRKSFSDVGTQIKYSIRAGVHVHVNCQQLTTKQMFIFATCYYVLENILTKFCGEDRDGNLNCLKASDAEQVITFVINSLNEDDLGILNTDMVRYSALNYMSLFRFGTLEFRAMGTYDGLGRVSVWAKTLHNLKEWSGRFKELPEIVEYFSEVGSDQFVEEALGDNFEAITSGKIDTQDIMSGMRVAQEICYHQYMR